MNVYSIFQRTQARTVPSSLSLLFKGLPELRSGRQPARLIDPVVNLPVTGLVVNRSIHHVLNRTKPALHPPLSRRNPIECCAPYAPPISPSTPFFELFFLFPKPLDFIGPNADFFFSFFRPPPLFAPLKSCRASSRRGFRHRGIPAPSLLMRAGASAFIESCQRGIPVDPNPFPMAVIPSLSRDDSHTA